MTASYWHNRPLLITGAGGFIGSHLTETLARLGARVRAFVRYNSRRDWGMLHLLPQSVLDRIEVIPGDLRDLSALRAAAADVTHIFHLGALIAIPYSYHHPTEVVETNVIGTLNLLLAARDNRIERLIHTSSSEVYGTAKKVPIDETHPLRAQSPYAASKTGADQLARAFQRSFDLPVAILRPFNTYGPRQSTRAVIPTIITQALTQDVINLGALDSRRDLTYITDTVDGFLKIAQTPGVAGRTFNLGTGTDISIRDLTQTILELVGKTLPIEIDPTRLRPEKSEVQRLLADSTLAKTHLGWQPQIPLRDGLRQTIQWYTQNLHRYEPETYHL